MDKLFTKLHLKLILNAVSTVGIILLVVLILNWGHHQGETTAQIKKQNEQIKTLTAQNNSLSKQVAASNTDIKTHIDCIITFFGLSPAERLNRSIADVCHFSPNPANPRASASTASPQSSATSGVSPGSSSASTQPKQPSTPAQPNPPQPVNVLGLPLCLPLVTNVCVEH